MNKEIVKMQKIAGLLKENLEEGSSSQAEKLEDAISNLFRSVSTDSNIPTASKEGLLSAFKEMMTSVQDILASEEEDSFSDGDDEIELEEGNDYFKKRKKDDAAYHGIKKRSNNPEGDKLVSAFLEKIANRHEYSLEDAARFVKERLIALGYN